MPRVFVALLFALWAVVATAQTEPFEVEEIRVEGLQRIAEGTVFNYLPIQVGARVTGEEVAAAIRALYDTGFFQDVRLLRDGDTLVVDVVERPAVARIEIFGNSAISEENLLQGLRDAGLAEGRTFNRSLLANIERSLEQQYFALGLYDVQVTSTVSPLPRNRVSVRLDIREGEPAAVREVVFVGNEAFDDETLRDRFQLGPSPWWAFLSSSDKYSQQKLAADLEALRSFYQDRGFINFNVTSTQVSISPDRRRITVTVNIDEGEQFRIGEIELAGRLIYPEEELRALLEVASGELFSRRAVTATQTAIQEKLGERGYAFANVNAVPEINEETGTVDLTFFVDPAERVYVRSINITGNERTRDDVIRRELLQLEGTWLSTERLRASRDRLGRLGFFQDVNIETPRVPGTSDQVDVDVTVTERLSGSLQAGIGYGTDQGVLLNFGIQQDNAFGSGDRIGFTANNSRINTIYQVSYLDRYYTKEGVDRNIALAYRETDAGEADLADYDVTSITGTYGYRFPLSEQVTIGADFEYEDLELRLRDDPTELQQSFVDQYGNRNSIYRLELSWTRDSRDSAIFPSRGAQQRISADVAIPGTDLEYYRLNYSHRQYLPITDTLTLALEGQIGYADGYGATERLPFFENFYAGGISTVRGFRSNTLGPRDENDDPIGGNARLLGRIELRFPPPGVEGAASSTQIGVFVDAGQTWSTYTDEIDLAELRYSAGLALTWYSPLGPLTMSLAQPLNDEPVDETQFFQFSLGTFF
jgi:outer membrane protein insertion porin family